MEEERVYVIDDEYGIYIISILISEKVPWSYHLEYTENGILLELGLV
jgi:hypothetical protein